MTRGLFIGRFNPFHLGHLEIIKKALKEVDELIIGVGSSQEKNTKQNPFSAEERIEMVEYVLAAEDIGNYTIYPIPDFHDDKKWTEHIENLVPKFDIVYISDKNTLSEKVMEKCFKGKYKIKKLKAIKGIDATDIRKRIANNKSYQDLLPKATMEYLEKIKGIQRIKKIYSKK